MARRRPHIRDKTPKKNIPAIIFLVFIVIGLSSSALFFGFGDGGGKIRYNDVKFVYHGDYWSGKINGIQTF